MPSICRCILVLYSHRGLVKNGYPNLKLFNSLHWIFIVFMVCFNIGVFPLSHILKDMFPGNSIKGQICMKLEFQLGEMNNKQRFFMFIGPVIFFVFKFRFGRNCKAYVRANNLNMRTFSQFGGTHHRNIFTLKDTGIYMTVILLLAYLDNILIILFQQSSIDKRTQFIIHNIPWILVCDLLFGIYVPVKHFFSSKHLLPGLWWEIKQVKRERFYVGETALIPRRDYEPHLETKKSFAYISKNCLQGRKEIIDDKPEKFYQVIRHGGNKVIRIKVKPLRGPCEEEEM